MGAIKIYVSDSEKAEIEEMAIAEGVGISSLIKSKLQLKSTSKISKALEMTIEKAEALPPCEFNITELFTGVEWGNMIKEVSAGQLGKQFYTQVIAGNVEGISFLDMKNRKALYSKK